MHSTLRQGAGFRYTGHPTVARSPKPADDKFQELEKIVREMSDPLVSGETVYQDPLAESPPSYEVATDTNMTDVKRPVSEGDTEETDGTRPKTPADSFSSDDESSDSETEEKKFLPIRNKNELLMRIELLRKEQEEIKRKQDEHDRHIQELLKREPYVNRSLKAIGRTMSRDSNYSNKKFTTGNTDNSTNGNNNEQLHQVLLPDQKIYVQLEQLYTNFQVIHFPNKTLQTIFGEQARTPTYYEVNTGNELRKLKEENDALKQKVKTLEAKLRAKEQAERRAPPPPHQLTIEPPRLRPARSEGRLNEIPRSPQPSSRCFVAGRPMQPLPFPFMPKDIIPMEATFKWTISDYRNKFIMHRASTTHRETSSPFYVTHCGYRAQMEAYLNGNGTGIDKCMSIFLRVIKGDHDRDLKWPVNLHMDVILVNQSGNNSDSLKAGGNQFQFNKPCGTTDSESDCWGLIEFVSHDMIKQRQYIHNDKIVLKCKIQLLP